MDTGSLVVLALVLIAVGVGMVLLTRSRAAGFALSSRPLRSESASFAADEVGLDPVGDVRDVPVPTPIPLAPKPQLEALTDGWRDEMRRAVAEQETRIERLDERVADLSQRFDRRLDELVNDIRFNRDDMATRQAAVDARQEAAIERLRADMKGSLGERGGSPVGPGTRLEERRLEVTADLYARLARLEAAVAAVTNPVLLPGEDYTPPAELLDEALVWENWKEVGERIFGLADAYSAQRLFLSDETRAEVAAFVSEVRAFLTRQVYPTLQGNPAPSDLQALNDALAKLSGDLAAVRSSLEREFRAVSGAPAPSRPPR